MKVQILDYFCTKTLAIIRCAHEERFTHEVRSFDNRHRRCSLIVAIDRNGRRISRNCTIMCKDLLSRINDGRCGSRINEKVSGKGIISWTNVGSENDLLNFIFKNFEGHSAAWIFGYTHETITIFFIIRSEDRVLMREAYGVQEGEAQKRANATYRPIWILQRSGFNSTV